ncbi:peptidylprolyl isomerase [bacterium]|nr:peptidylprolyl isomerase [bacterium]
MSKHFIFPLISILIAVFAVLFNGCAPSVDLASESELVATWDDTSMTVTDLKNKLYVRYSNESRAMKKTLEDRMKILDEYVVRALKIAEGYRLKFNEREDILKSYNEAIARKASELLYDEKVLDQFITDKMVQDFFEHDRWEVRCRHLLIEIPEDVTGRDTIEYWDRINEIWEKTEAGEKFKRLVNKYSEDTSIDRKLYGDLGFFKWGKMVDEFQEAAWKLKPDEISPPVRTRYGYHLIQLIEKRSRGLEMHTSHILVKINKRAAPAETTIAFERAKMILDEAKKKGANFSELARRYSEDDKTWVNGEIGWIPRGSMPTEYWDQVLEMEVGEIDGPFRTYKGYHVVRVNETREQERSLDDPDMLSRVKSSISRVYRDSVKVISETYLEEVFNSFDMKYNNAAVKLLKKKLFDKNAPKNMNLFSSFTVEEREMFIIEDNYEGFKIQGLVDMYGDHRFPPQIEDEPDFVKNLVEPLLLPKYLEEIARREGYFDNPECLAEGKKAIENAMLPEVEREMIQNKAAPSEEEVKTYYEKNVDEFTDQEKVKIYEILLDDKQLAEDMLTRINKGEDVARLAQRYSQRKLAKQKKGKLGPFTKDKYGPLSRKAFDLEIGEVAGPIKAGNMYSVIKLIERTPKRVKTFDESRRQIESNIRFERQKSLKNSWVEELKEYYNLKYYKDVVKRLWPLIEPLPEALVAERKVWKKDREDAAKKAKLRAKEDLLKLKLQPGSEQEFTTKDGKRIQVKIGQPRYVDKDGKEIDPSKSNIRLTPKGKLEKKDGGESQAPSIKVVPKGK